MTCSCVFQHGETAVHMAASGGHVDVLKFLLAKGVDISIKDKVIIPIHSLSHISIEHVIRHTYKKRLIQILHA